MFKALRALMRCKRGSVMMEFIIVMPIYLVLFGGTCAVGELLVHSGRLLSADRFSAFFADERFGASTAKQWIEETMFPFRVDQNGDQLDDIHVQSQYHYADVTAPWSVCAAANTADSFGKSAGGGVAQVLFGKQFFRRANGRVDNSGFWDDYETSGRKVLFSRPGVGVGAYGRSYYILKRKRSFRKTWRDAPGSVLMKQKYRDCAQGHSAWETEVYEEGWFDTADKIGDAGPASARPCQFQNNVSDCWYSRYGQFIIWSKYK